MLTAGCARGGSIVLLLLGAGFSKWAADLPLARELFDFRIRPFGVREEGQLRFIRDLKANWDSEHPQGFSEEFVAYALNRDHRAATAVRQYVARRLSEPYIWEEWHAGRRRRHVLMIDESRKADRPGVEAARRFLQRLLKANLSGIVTTNYDLLIEYALGTGGFNYGCVGEHLDGRGPYPLSQWRKPVVLRGSLPVAKVHGSISWDEDGRYTDGRRGISGKALIVAPGPGKRPPTTLERDWTLAASLLNSTRRLVVFGFAFNPYDEVLLQHLETHGEAIHEVLLIDITPNESAARQLWPRAEIRSGLPPPHGEAESVEWLDARSRRCRRRRR